jgi:hypothetical protein
MSVFAWISAMAMAQAPQGLPVRITADPGLRPEPHCTKIGPLPLPERVYEALEAGAAAGEPYFATLNAWSQRVGDADEEALAGLLAALEAEVAQARSAPQRRLGDQLVRSLRAQLATDLAVRADLMRALKDNWSPRLPLAELLAGEVLSERVFFPWDLDGDPFVRRLLRARDPGLRELASAELLCDGLGPPGRLSRIEAKRQEPAANLLVVLADLWAERGRPGKAVSELERADPWLANLEQAPRCQPLTPAEEQALLARSGAEEGVAIVPPPEFCGEVLSDAVALVNRLQPDRAFGFAPDAYRGWFGALEACQASCGSAWATVSQGRWQWAEAGSEPLKACLAPRLASLPSPPGDRAVSFSQPCPGVASAGDARR